MHVLLVEDSDEVSCITVEYLQELGHEVTAVGSAEEAVPKIDESAIDLIMTDVRLPGMSGLELAKLVVKKYPRLPVVIASGFGAIDVQMLTGEKLANVSSLPKPYDLDELDQTLKAAVSALQS
jgi:DNA-binding NtrC family response regulator